MFYVIIYLTIFIFAIFSSRTTLIVSHRQEASGINENRTNGVNFFLFFCFLIFIFLGALRGEDVGIDTRSYTGIYQRFADGWSVGAVKGFATTIETGYLIFSKIVVTIFKSRFAFFLCNGIIIYGCYLRYIKKHSEDLMLSVLLFTALYFTSTFNVMRQYAAIGIMLIGLDELREKKYVKALIFVTIACTFHQSSLLLLPGLLLIMIPKKIKYLIWYEIGIVGLLLIIRTPVVLNRLLVIMNYRRLLNGIHFKASDSNGIMAYIYIIIVALGLITAKKYKKDEDEEFAFNLINTSVGTGSAFLASSNEMFARAGAGYIVFLVILFPMILNRLFMDNHSRRIARITVCLLLTIAMYINGRSYHYTIY